MSQQPFQLNPNTNLQQNQQCPQQFDQQQLPQQQQKQPFEQQQQNLGQFQQPSQQPYEQQQPQPQSQQLQQQQQSGQFQQKPYELQQQQPQSQQLQQKQQLGQFQQKPYEQQQQQQLPLQQQQLQQQSGQFQFQPQQFQQQQQLGQVQQPLQQPFNQQQLGQFPYLQQQQQLNPQILNFPNQLPNNLGQTLLAGMTMQPGMQPYNQLISSQYRPSTLQNNEQQIKLQEEIQAKEQIIKQLKQELNKFKSASEDCLSEKDKLRRGENALKAEVIEKDEQIQKQKKQIQQLQEQILDLEQEIKKLRQQKSDNESSYNFKLKNLKIELEDQVSTNKQLNELIRTYEQNINNNNNNKAEIEMVQTLKKQMLEMNEKVTKKNQEIQEFEQKHQKEKAEWEYRYQQTMQMSQQENQDSLKIQRYEEQIQQMNRTMTMLQQKMKEVQCSADNLQTLLVRKDLEIQSFKIENQSIKYELEIIQEKQILYERQVTKITQNMQAQNSQASVQQQQDSFQQELNRLQEAANKRVKIQEASRIELQQLEIQKKQDLLRFKAQANKEKKEYQRKQGKMLAEAMMETHGKIQVCFVVDVTGSMDEYKETTMKCIQGTMSNIKEQTHRDTIWATVAYQDFGELAEYQKHGNKYFQHRFTEDQKKIYDYLDKIKCDGGDDGAEDIRGGLKQMVNDLEWNKNFKMAILICDAPSHGAKWAGNVLDDHPDEDLTDALLKLIENKIMLIGVIFDVRTRIMFKQMQEFYKAQDKQEYLLVVEMEKMNHEQIKEALIKLISDASVQLTHTKNAATHTKQNAKPKSNDGAMEALCKSGINPMNFDQQQNIKTTACEFAIFRVEIQEDSFENKIEDIFSIQMPDNYKKDPKDFNITEEGKWKCIRTVMPYAFGQMKAVFLMRKQQSKDEVYVIKMPIGDTTYSSLEEALAECRSHLISKRLMSRFMSELKQKKQEKNSPLEIIDIVYSDFLILKENEKSFWIAERYFQGDFVKFNNNYGFISDKTDTLNKIAQTYSYYTYVTSGFSYVVNDVQGVGQYFTDPAINTQLGGFDETDIGLDGIGMYMVSLQKYKELIKDYIHLLEIDLD